jgi:DNA topoisomerase-1
LDEDDEEVAGLLPQMKEGDPLVRQKITSTERYTRPPSRFVEASLVKKLEELGIGRPSTYAPTISTIQKRGYVDKGERDGSDRDFEVLLLEKDTIKQTKNSEKTGSDKGKLVPTDIGRVVTEFLIDNFDQIMNYNFTANVEKEFDDIAKGLVDWTKMIGAFYKPFHVKVENTLEHSDRASGERLIGVDPVSGKNMYARIGRFGPMVQIGESDDEDKPKFASIGKNHSIQTITIEQGLELFKFPKVIGEFEGEAVKVNKGRFGPYVQLGKLFVSIKESNGDTLETMEISRAIELIIAKREEDSNRLIKSFKEDKTMELTNGRYGAYLKIGKKNFKLPKGTDPTLLSFDECIEISKNQPKPKGKKK